MLKLVVLVLVSLLLVTACSKDLTQTKASQLKKTLIINGTEIKDQDPRGTSIVGVYNTKIQAICTGSLIAPNVVLTAAHCAPDKPSHLKIMFANDLDMLMNSREPDIKDEFMLSVTDFKVSPIWNPKNETVEVDTGDIALVKFKGNIPRGFKPANFLTDASELKIGAIVTVAGFGVSTVDMEEIDPKRVRKDDVEAGDVVCSSENNGKYSNCFEINRSGDGVLRITEAPISFVHDTEIRLNEKKAGTCNGDSGGPAFILKNGELLLFGVTSRGSELCNEVGVYTNALSYKKWINETISILK